MAEPQMSPLQRQQLVDYHKSVAERWINEEDRALIRQHFKGNRKLLMVLKKFILPAYSDPNMPFEFTSDAFVKGLQIESLSVEEVKAIWSARQIVIQWFGQALGEIDAVANQEEETEEQSKRRRAQDDTH